MGYSNARLATCFRCAPFVLNANPLPRDFFLISATLFVQARRDSVGYSNARLATCFRCAPFVPNANPLSRDFFLISATLFVQARRVADIRKHPLWQEGVCVGRSYRNRTYTVGVRGPSATTTPSSIAYVIIYHRSQFCNRF